MLKIFNCYNYGDKETVYIPEYNCWMIPRWKYKKCCEFCGKEFIHNGKPTRKFCSDRCRNDNYIKVRKERKILLHHKTCMSCGVEFDAARSDKKFCSNKCRQKWYRDGKD